jgi:hypothetical protein
MNACVCMYVLSVCVTVYHDVYIPQCTHIHIRSHTYIYIHVSQYKSVSSGGSDATVTPSSNSDTQAAARKGSRQVSFADPDTQRADDAPTTTSTTTIAPSSSSSSSSSSTLSDSPSKAGKKTLAGNTSEATHAPRTRETRGDSQSLLADIFAEVEKKLDTPTPPRSSSSSSSSSSAAAAAAGKDRAAAQGGSMGKDALESRSAKELLGPELYARAKKLAKSDNSEMREALLGLVLEVSALGERGFLRSQVNSVVNTLIGR